MPQSELLSKVESANLMTGIFCLTRSQASSPTLKATLACGSGFPYWPSRQPSSSFTKELCSTCSQPSECKLTYRRVQWDGTCTRIKIKAESALGTPNFQGAEINSIFWWAECIKVIKKNFTCTAGPMLRQWGEHTGVTRIYVTSYVFPSTFSLKSILKTLVCHSNSVILSCTLQHHSLLTTPVLRLKPQNAQLSFNNDLKASINKKTMLSCI